MFGLLGQRYTQRVADALEQQPADAHARFDQPHAAAAGLGDADVQGVVGLGREHAVSGHHARHVGGLDGDDDVVKVVLFQQAHVVERAFDHGFRHRGAVFGQDVFFEAAAVDADADGHVFGVAGVGHGLDVLVGADVAGVDADLVRPGVQRGERGAVVEMDVGHDGDVDGFLDGGHDGGIRRGGHRHADDLAAGRRHPLGLGDVAGDVLDRDVEHRLHRDGVVPADGDVADLDFTFDLARHGLLPPCSGPGARA